MLRSILIKAVLLAFAVFTLGVSSTQARDLTSKESTVCASLKACLDITRRHDASEFDYSVLETEFRRFGPRSQVALLDVLKTDDGQADIATLISALGSLTPQMRQKIQSDWSPEKAQSYLPLLKDGHPMSRDLLLLSLGHANADVREDVRIALLMLPETVKRAPVSDSLTDPLLAALKIDPIDVAAPYLSRLSAAGKEDDFAALLRSGEAEIVSAAYAALYRNSPSRAFNLLLAEMEAIQSPAQSRAIGQMLAMRHAARPDGFYLKFARDMSGDEKLSTSARASGLHGLILMKPESFAELTSERAEALSYLTKGQPFAVQNYYLPYLQDVEAVQALGLIWEIAALENWINLDRIAAFYSDHSAYDEVITALLQSNDRRSFTAGLALAKPLHEPLVRDRLNDPVVSIANAARQNLGLEAQNAKLPSCQIKPFDVADIRAQMPFFDEGWMVADNKARVTLSRSFLTSAHPTRTGWLAAYDLEKPNARSVHSGGAVLQYDNLSGASDTVGAFTAPLAILPNRPLRLGETTSQFWVIDGSGGDSFDISAYTLNVAGNIPNIRHIGRLPYKTKGYSVALNGDLLITFFDDDQPPLRLSKSGSMSLACAQQLPSNMSRAPK